MCPKALFGGGGDKAKTPDTLPEPEKLAEPSEIGEARKAEDNVLFGGIPDLRVDRTAVAPSISSTGTGLGVM